MIIKQLTLATLDTGTLDFGFVGENEHIKFVIKCDSVFDEYPTATASLLIKAPDNTIYPKTVEVEGYNVGWVITASDTAYPGSGQIQLTFTEDGAVVKTVIANTNVKDSLVGDDPPPDPIADWISTANQILGKVDGMTATAESLPSGDNPSVTVETVDGHYNLEFGIPAGDPGDPTEIIDDNAGVGDTTKVWSANKSATDLSELKSDIDRKAPAIFRDASGDIVTFSDGADNMPLSSCVVQIDPVQSGSGDPAPDNVRPITGWTGANVYRTGINIWDEQWEVGGYKDDGSESTVVTNKIRSKNYISVVPGAQYYCKNPATATGLNVYCYSKDKAFIQLIEVGASNRVLTVPANGYFIRFSTFGTATTTYANDISINYPSTDTAYHAYTGTAYPISWQTAAGTVYGGTVDTVTGVLTVTKVSNTRPLSGFDVVGTTANTKHYRYFGEFFASGTGQVKNNDNAICNIVPYAYNSNDAPHFYMVWNGTNNQNRVEIWFPLDTPSSTEIQICAELVTPITYQLDPVQIKTLLGYNALWADTGAVAVTYPADTQTYVDTLVQTATDPDGNVVQVTGSTPSITGESGKRYVCGTVDSISITPPSTGIIDVVFTSGTTPTVLTVPNTVRFPAWFNSASIDASTKYEINIMDGTDGAVMAWQT